MDALPDALCVALLCSFIPLRDRVYALSRVSRRWRRLAWRSIRGDRLLDLTWCTGDHELECVVAAVCNRDELDATQTKLQAFRLYGPRVNTTVLHSLMTGVGATQVKCIQVESKQIDDEALLHLAKCTELVDLTLHCVKLTSHALSQIARSCTNLESLNLAGSSRVCDIGVMDAATKCARLRELNLSMCHRVSDRSIAALGFRKQKTLVRVVVDRCIKISGLAIRFLMKSQPLLHELSFAHCPRIHDHDFLALSKQLSSSTSQLRAIDMSGCAQLSDEGVAALTSRNAETLRCLSARALFTLSSVGFASISRCKQLTDLNLNMDRTLQNTDLSCILASCSSLRSLKLQGCVHIDDCGAEAIACHGTQLAVLSLEFCYNITDDGFAQIVSSCHHLQDLNVKALNQLTFDAFDSLISLKSSVAPLRRINIGAIADFETTLRYASLIKRRYPRARIEWT